MELRQLIYFVQIVKDGTFSSAAKTLFVSQPALSKSIKLLEDELGASLFSRNEKRGELTQVGKVLYERAQIILKEYQLTLEAVNEISQFRKEQLHIGIPHGLGQQMFYQIATEFSESNPTVEIAMFGYGFHRLQRELLDGKIDIGATIVPTTILDGLEAINLTVAKFYLLLSQEHPLARRKFVCFSDLRDEQFIMLNDEFAVTTLTRLRCEAAGFTPHVKLVVDRTEVSNGMVADQFGIMVLVGGGDYFLDNARLCCAPIEDDENEVRIALIVPTKDYRPNTTRKFIEFTQEYIAKRDGLGG